MSGSETVLPEEYAVTLAYLAAVFQELLVIAAQGGISGEIVQISGVVHIEQAPHFAVIALFIEMGMDDLKALLESADVGAFWQQGVHFGVNEPAFG